MKMNDILNVIEVLSHHQGFYGRLYRDIIELRESDKNGYDCLKEELESQNFKDDLDVIEYFEC